MSKVKIDDIGLVVVVDVQEYFSRIIYNGSNEMFLVNTKKVLEYFNKKGTKVVFVEYADSGMTIPEVFDVVVKQNQKITCKKYTNGAFDSGEFKKILDIESQTVKKILFLGLENNYCLFETVKGALERRYDAVVSYELMTGLGHLSYHAKKVYEKCNFLDYVFQNNKEVAWFYRQLLFFFYLYFGKNGIMCQLWK